MLVTRTADELAKDAMALAEGNGRRVILGLAGAPGAGKSTLARAIVAGARAASGDDWAAYLPLDGFHLSNAQLARLGLEDCKGAPATFDADGYAALLARVSSDDHRDIYAPDYDRTLHEPVAARHLIPARARLVVTEGNYLAVDAAQWRDARRHIDHLWYIEAADEVRERRLVERQLSGGKTPAAAADWVHHSDRPNGELVKRSKARADRVVIVA